MIQLSYCKSQWNGNHFQQSNRHSLFLSLYRSLNICTNLIMHLCKVNKWCCFWLGLSKAFISLRVQFHSPLSALILSLLLPLIQQSCGRLCKPEMTLPTSCKQTRACEPSAFHIWHHARWAVPVWFLTEIKGIEGLDCAV